MSKFMGMSKLNVLDITQDSIYQNPTREADRMCRQPDTGGVGFFLSKWKLLLCLWFELDSSKVLVNRNKMTVGPMLCLLTSFEK